LDSCGLCLLAFLWSFFFVSLAMISTINFLLEFCFYSYFVIKNLMWNDKSRVD
jgi:hypothetical protein